MAAAFMHRHVDVLAFAAVEPVVKRYGDAEGAVGRGHAVSDFSRRLQRRLARFAGEIEQVAQRDAGHVIGFVIFPWAVLAEGRDRGDDQCRIDRAEILIGQRQFLGARRPIGFDDHIGFFAEFEQDRPAVGLLDVEGDAALVGVEVKKVQTLFRMRLVIFERRHAARFVAGRRFDFDHVGAHVGKSLVQCRLSGPPRSSTR